MYLKIHLLLLLNVITKLTYSTKITIYHASDYNGIFEELPNRKGQLVGGLARVKHSLADQKNKFIFTGNFIHKPYESGRPRLKIEIALLEYLRPEVVVLGNNEYSMSYENFQWYLHNSHLRIVSTTIEHTDDTRDIASVHRLDKDIRVVSYNPKSTAMLPGAVTLAVQDPVIALNAKTYESKGNFTIAAGCAGMKEIKDMIMSTENIQLFLTGCSKSTFQWNSADPLPPEGANITSTYPVEMLNYKGKRVLVAHSYGSTKFLGKIEIETDDNGQLLKHNGQMLYLTDNIPEDPNFVTLTEALKAVEVARSRVFLNGTCSASECNLGNLITDAFIQYKVDTFNKDEFWTDVSIALMPAGNIKSSIDTIPSGGYITMNHLSKVFPEKQHLVTVKVQGGELKKSIELALNDTEHGTNKFLQVSGLIIRFHSRKDPQHRLAIRVRCAKCKIPSYSSLKSSQTYKIITTTNLAAGAFGHYVLGNASKVQKREIITDYDAVLRYIKAQKLIRASRSDRIIRIDKEFAKPEEEKTESLGKHLKSTHTTVLGITCVYYLLNKWT